MSTKKYTVTANCRVECTAEVEATSPEEAKSLLSIQQSACRAAKPTSAFSGTQQPPHHRHHGGL